jgi:hypothetical protein
MISPICLDDDDDDVAIIDDRLMSDGAVSNDVASSVPAASSSHPSSSSSSSSAPDSKFERDPFNMTDISVHQFPTYDALRSWMKDYSTKQGSKSDGTRRVESTRHSTAVPSDAGVMRSRPLRRNKSSLRPLHYGQRASRRPLMQGDRSNVAAPGLSASTVAQTATMSSHPLVV